MTGPIVTAAWLRDALGEPGLRVVDCRYRLGEPGAGEQLWREGHIPGAAFLDVDRDLAAPPGEGGRHPLPSAEQFESAARRAGIRTDTLVIAYDEAGEGGAARLWWLLRHFGHEQVAVLDGALRGWREEGGPVTAGPEEIEPGDFVARRREGDTTSAEELLAAGAGGVPGAAASPRLLDARAPERYRGEAEPIDPVAGRIPGARNLPFAEVAPDGRFLRPEELRARLETGGVAYCGSGITACVLVLAAEVAGVGPVRLYPGSWSEWSGRGLPVEAGEPAARQ